MLWKIINAIAEALGYLVMLYMGAMLLFGGKVRVGLLEFTIKVLDPRRFFH